MGFCPGYEDVPETNYNPQSRSFLQANPISYTHQTNEQDNEYLNGINLKSGQVSKKKIRMRWNRDDWL